MSVYTDADEQLDRAKKSLTEATIHLSKVVHPETWGSRDFNSEAKQKFNRILFELKKLEIELND